MEEDRCPECALSEKEALFLVAEGFRQGGEDRRALEYYERFLRLEPSHFEAACQSALCLSRMAMESHEEALFARATQALSRTLEGDWTWEKGHQARVALSQLFGKLPLLLKEYEILGQEPWRKPVCDEMARVIRLSMDYGKTARSLSLESGERSELRSSMGKFWPFVLGLPILSATAYGLSDWMGGAEAGNRPIFFLFILVIGTVIVYLILAWLKSYFQIDGPKKAKKNAKKD